MQNLAVTLIQRELAWENPADNRGQMESLLHELPGHWRPGSTTRNVYHRVFDERAGQRRTGRRRY